MKGKNVFSITKDTECSEVSKIPQIDSPWHPWFNFAFRCQLEIFLIVFPSL